MTPAGTSFPFFLAFGVVCIAPVQTSRADKGALSAAIESRAEPTWQAALQIWDWAEPGYQEVKSAKLLSDMLERQGFKVERGVAGIPTAFTATAGSGKPVIGILGEYDALPGLAQEAVPEQKPRAPLATAMVKRAGIIYSGAASAAAAIAIAEQLAIDKRSGTVRFYGCPAEEGGAAKVFMVREGLFKDCDVVLHPGIRAAGMPPAMQPAQARGSLRNFVFMAPAASWWAASPPSRAAVSAGARRRRADELRRRVVARAHA